MEQQKILLLFKDGIVDFGEVADLSFAPELVASGHCRITLKKKSAARLRLRATLRSKVSRSHRTLTSDIFNIGKTLRKIN